MDLKILVDDLKDCPCGREHNVYIDAIEIGSGLLARTASILLENNFPSKILLVADKNTLRASEGIVENLEAGGFDIKLKVYDDLRTADMVEVRELEELSKDVLGILSVGSGSLNDVCRLAAFKQDKEFAIFATAPSMDGFASGTTPITENNFKTTHQAKQPSVIIADTKILAESPDELKSAGFGDMVAKYIALTDWRISHLLTGEYYCDRIARLTEDALATISSLAHRVTEKDEETMAEIMEALVFAGVSMTLSGSVRPASGAEHVISHFWEIKKLEEGKISDFHGKKVGVATLIVNNIYRELAKIEEIDPIEDVLDWDRLYKAYGPNFIDEVRKLNTPTVTQETSPEDLKKNWPKIRRIIEETLPTKDRLLNLMKSAGAATRAEEIDISPELERQAIEYHAYMRYRMTLMRLIPMLNLDKTVSKSFF